MDAVVVQIKGLVKRFTTTRNADHRRTACDDLRKLAFEDANFEALREANAIEALVGALVWKPPLSNVALDASKLSPPSKLMALTTAAACR